MQILNSVIKMQLITVNKLPNLIITNSSANSSTDNKSIRIYINCSDRHGNYWSCVSDGVHAVSILRWWALVMHALMWCEELNDTPILWCRDPSEWYSKFPRWHTSLCTVFSQEGSRERTDEFIFRGDWNHLKIYVVTTSSEL